MEKPDQFSLEYIERYGNDMKVKVVKFGGSSLADAEHFKQVARIIKSDPSRRYVVPSAPGKRFKDDVKEVNHGYECGCAIEGFNEIRIGDIIECYVTEEIKA